MHHDILLQVPSMNEQSYTMSKWLFNETDKTNVVVKYRIMDILPK